MKDNLSIKCDINSCKHNDCQNSYCVLDAIKVSCNCPHDAAKSKDVTICESFECNDANEK